MVTYNYNEVYNRTYTNCVSVIIIDANENPIPYFYFQITSGEIRIYSSWSGSYSTYLGGISGTTDEYGVATNVVNLTTFGDGNETIDNVWANIDNGEYYNFYCNNFSGDRKGVLIFKMDYAYTNSCTFYIIDKSTSIGITGLTDSNIWSSDCAVTLYSQGNGYYEVSGLVMGATVEINADGYNTEEYVYTGASSTTIKLEATLPYTISGTATDVNGLGVSNATINLKYNGNVISSANVINGQYSIKSPYSRGSAALNSYGLEIVSNYYNTATNRIGVEGYDFVNTVQFKALTGVNITVNSSTGGTVSEPSITCMYLTKLLKEGTGSANGSFIISNIPTAYKVTGNVKISVSKTGYYSKTETLGQSVENLIITLTKDPNVQITITGKVDSSYKPTGGTSFNGKVFAAGNSSYYANLRNNGQFEISIPENIASQGLRFDVDNHNPLTITLPASVLTNGGTIEDVTLERIDNGEVIVRVQSGNNYDVDDATVTAIPTGDTQQTINIANESHQYVFDAPSIRYSITGQVSVPGYGSINWGLTDRANINFVKSVNSYFVSGYVKNSSGQGVSNVRVYVGLNNEDSTTTDENGHYEFNFSSSKNGEVVYVMAENYNIGSAKINGSTVPDIRLTPYQQTNITLTVKYGSNALEGIVVYVADSAHTTSGSTDAEGKVTFEDISNTVLLNIYSTSNYNAVSKIITGSQTIQLSRNSNASSDISDENWHPTTFAIPWQETQVHLRYNVKDISNGNTQQYISQFVQLPVIDAGATAETQMPLPYGGATVDVVNVPVSFTAVIGNKQYTFSTRSLYKECKPPVYVEKPEGAPEELDIHTFYPVSIMLRYKNGYKEGNVLPNYLDADAIKNNVKIVNSNGDSIPVNLATGDKTQDSFFEIKLTSALNENGPKVYTNISIAPHDVDKYINKLSANYKKWTLHSEACTLTANELNTEFVYGKKYNNIIIGPMEYTFTQDGHTEIVNLSNLNTYMPKPVFTDLTFGDITMTGGINGNGISFTTTSDPVTFDTISEEPQNITLHYAFDYNLDTTYEMSLTYAIKSDPLITIYGIKFDMQHIGYITYDFTFKNQENPNDICIVESYFQGAYDNGNPAYGFTTVGNCSLLLTYAISGKSFENETVFRVSDYAKYQKIENEDRYDYYIYNSYTLVNGWANSTLMYTSGNLPDLNTIPENENDDEVAHTIFEENYAIYVANTKINNTDNVNDIKTLVGTYETTDAKTSDIKFTYVVKHVEADNLISYYENGTDTIYELSEDEVTNYYYDGSMPETEHITDKWDSTVDIINDTLSVTPRKLVIDTRNLFNNIFGILYNVDEAGDNLFVNVPDSIRTTDNRISVYIPNKVDVTEPSGEGNEGGEGGEGGEEQIDPNADFNTLFNKFVSFINSKTTHNILCNEKYFNEVISHIITPISHEWYIGGKFIDNETIKFGSFNDDTKKNIADKIIEIDAKTSASSESGDATRPFNPDHDYDTISFITLDDVAQQYMNLYETEGGLKLYTDANNPLPSVIDRVTGYTNFFNKFIKPYEDLKIKLHNSDPTDPTIEGIDYGGKQYYIYDLEWPTDETANPADVANNASEVNRYDNFIDYLNDWKSDESILRLMIYLYAKYYELGYLRTICYDVFSILPGNTDSTCFYGDDPNMYRLDISLAPENEPDPMPYLFVNNVLSKVNSGFDFATGESPSEDKPYIPNYVYEDYVYKELISVDNNDFMSFYRNEVNGYVDTIFKSFKNAFTFNSDNIDDFISTFKDTTFRFYIGDNANDNEISRMIQIMNKINTLQSAGINIERQGVDDVIQLIDNKIKALQEFVPFIQHIGDVVDVSSDSSTSAINVTYVSVDNTTALTYWNMHTYYADNEGRQKLERKSREVTSGNPPETHTEYYWVKQGQNTEYEGTCYYRETSASQGSSTNLTTGNFNNNWRTAIDFYEILHSINENATGGAITNIPKNSNNAQKILSILNATMDESVTEIHVHFNQDAFDAYKKYRYTSEYGTYGDDITNERISFNSLISVQPFNSTKYESYRNSIYSNEGATITIGESNNAESLANALIYKFLEFVNPILGKIYEFDDDAVAAATALSNNIGRIQSELGNESYRPENILENQEKQWLISQINSLKFNETNEDDPDAIAVEFKKMDHITSLYFIRALLNNFDTAAIKNRIIQHIQRAIMYTTHASTTQNEFANYVRSQRNNYIDELVAIEPYIKQYIKNEILNFKNDNTIKLQLNDKLVEWPENFIMPKDNVVRLNSHSYNGYDVLYFENVEELHINNYVETPEEGDPTGEPTGDPTGEPVADTRPINEYNIRYAITPSSTVFDASTDVYSLNPKIFKGTIKSTETENGFLHTLLYWNNVFVKEIVVKNNKVKAVNGTNNISDVIVSYDHIAVSLTFNIQNDIDSNISDPTSGSRVKVLEIKYMTNLDETGYREPELMLIPDGVTSVVYTIPLDDFEHNTLYVISYRLSWISTRGDEPIYSPANKVTCYVDMAALEDMKFGYYEFIPGGAEQDDLQTIQNKIQQVNDINGSDDREIKFMNLYYKKYNYVQDAPPMLFILNGRSTNDYVSTFTYVTTIIDETTTGDYGRDAGFAGVVPEVLTDYRKTTVRIKDYDTVNVSYIATFNTVTEENTEENNGENNGG